MLKDVADDEVDGVEIDDLSENNKLIMQNL